MPESLRSRICQYARENSEASAILAPNRPALTYGDLKARLEETAGALYSFGLGLGDRVGTLFPFGADGATLHLAIAGCATALPLDPRARAAEADYILEASGCRAIVFPAGMESEVVTAARARGIALIELDSDFTLRGPAVVRRPACEWASLEDVAIILCTSGTTSKPKLVPLTHRNLAGSLGYFEQALGMSPRDRCLNLAPMFHSLGLISGVFAPIFSGGSTVCLPGTIVSRFFERVEEFAATWYSAVPAVHDSIIGAAPRNSAEIGRRYLRFARTSSAMMSRELEEKLENTVGAPLVQVYGATEAPLSVFQAPPPFARKAGSVGVAAVESEIGILSEAGEFLPPGQIGEVVLGGPHVMSGYWNDPEATAQALHGRWFRTGDLGLLDADGYLFLKGRIKEIINRGGEKIAPCEIDDALARHPAVAKAVAYAVPHERLGEEIAALVLLKPGAEVTAEQLSHFSSALLPAYKVPRSIQVVADIPVTAIGKVNRRALAKQFPVPMREGCPSGSTCACEGSSILEEFLITLWKGGLKTTHSGRHTDFFQAGGDSLSGAELLLSIESALRARELRPSDLLKAPTPEKMAVFLSGRHSRPARAAAVTPWRATAGRPPINLVAPGYEIRQLASWLPPDQPLADLSVPAPLEIGLPYSIERIARECVRRLRERQPAGPYLLGGWCFAGIVAYEMATQLMAAGESVPLLIGFDLPDIAPGGRSGVAPPAFWPKVRFHSKQLRARPWREWLTYTAARLQTLGWVWRRVLSRAPSRLLSRLGQEPPCWLWTPALQQAQAMREYSPAPYPGRALHFVPRLRPALDKPLHWTALASGTWETFELPGDHLTMFESDALGARLESCLQSLDPPKKLRAVAGK